jgi:protein phosphatase 1 regulatory subunit 37
VSSSPSTHTSGTNKPESEVSNKAKAIILELSAVIQETENPARLEELLGINDELTALLAKVPEPVRPTLTLQGLGLWDTNPIQAINGSGNEEKQTVLSNGNGQAVHESPTEENHHQDGEDGPEPGTPKIDKGKGKAEPEPVEHEKVLTPTFVIPESEDEDEDGHRLLSVQDSDNVGMPSPTDR